MAPEVGTVLSPGPIILRETFAPRSIVVAAELRAPLQQVAENLAPVVGVAMLGELRGGFGEQDVLDFHDLRCSVVFGY